MLSIVRMNIIKVNSYTYHIIRTTVIWVFNITNTIVIRTCAAVRLIGVATSFKQKYIVTTTIFSLLIVLSNRKIIICLSFTFVFII